MTDELVLGNVVDWIVANGGTKRGPCPECGATYGLKINGPMTMVCVPCLLRRVDLGAGAVARSSDGCCLCERGVIPDETIVRLNFAGPDRMAHVSCVREGLSDPHLEILVALG